jgi:hypothetical protein
MSEIIEEKIGHLLPNPQILNFHTGVPTLPEAPAGDLRLMMGAGDHDQGGILNTEHFATYNVFFCYPEDNEGSLLRNVEYLLTTPGRLLCFADIENPAHINAFKQLFAGRFSFIDGFGGHCPHFDTDTLSVLLKMGGQAANIYERGEILLMKKDIDFWLENSTFKPFPKNTAVRIVERNKAMITARLHVNPDDLPKLTEQIREKVLRAQVSCRQIKIDREEINAADLHTLQQYACMQMFDNDMPLNLTGTYTMNKKDWWSKPSMEFIITKHAPDFQLGLIEAYETRHGAEDPEAKRARKLIGAIMSNISENRHTWSKLKYYTTFHKHIADKIKPAINGGRRKSKTRISKRYRRNKTRRS